MMKRKAEVSQNDVLPCLLANTQRGRRRKVAEQVVVQVPLISRDDHISRKEQIALKTGKAAALTKGEA